VASNLPTLRSVPNHNARPYVRPAARGSAWPTVGRAARRRAHEPSGGDTGAGWSGAARLRCLADQTASYNPPRAPPGTRRPRSQRDSYPRVSPSRRGRTVAAAKDRIRCEIRVKCGLKLVRKISGRHPGEHRPPFFGQARVSCPTASAALFRNIDDGHLPFLSRCGAQRNCKGWGPPWTEVARLLGSQMRSSRTGDFRSSECPNWPRSTQHPPNIHPTAASHAVAWRFTDSRPSLGPTLLNR
jgi:hypothetical protein